MVLDKNNRGQTSIEYLLLLAVAFLTSYIIVTGPAAGLTTDMLTFIRSGLGNVVKHGEWTTDTIEPAKGKHPGNPQRLKAVHL